MAAEVRLPLVGGVSRRGLLIGGGAAAVLLGVLYLRKRGTSTASPASSADGTGTDPTSDYLDPGLQDTTMGPTFGATGYQDPNTGQWVYGSTGTGQAAAVTNAQWAQSAIAYLGSNVAVDTALLSAALGAYLAGSALTAAQVGLVDQAIAAEGYPPVAGPGGYPPGIHTAGGGGGGGQGGSGGSGGGSGGSWAFPAPRGLHSYAVSDSGFSLAWHPVTGPHGQHPTSYTVRSWIGSKQIDSFTAHGTSAKEYGAGGHGLKPGSQVKTQVSANGAPKASPGAVIHTTIKKRGKRLCR